MSIASCQITPLSDQDIGQCAHVMASSEPWTRYAISFDAAHILWTKARQEGAAVVVARQDGVARGFAWYVAHGGFNVSGYLKLLGVSQEARGSGIGSALLAYVERKTVADGQRDLLLLVSDFNVAAQQFYQAHGYREIGALAEYVHPGITELIYRKRLQGESSS